MKYCFAPMEGITGYVYRNAHHQFFDQIDQYYTPFITPNQTRTLTSREVNDVLPEHNSGVRVVPQILTNKAEDFLWAAGKMKELGYDEVNLNLGCPSGTVVSKKRGSGFLAFPSELDEFLYQVSGGLQQMEMRLSVKTRIGKERPEEFEELLRIYNQYPLSSLIIHPRVQTDYYKNHPNWEVFKIAAENSRNPVCYNGDVFSVQNILTFRRQFPQVGTLMLGRGLLTNPALTRMAEIAADGTIAVHDHILDKQRFRSFHDAVLAGYRKAIPGDRNVLFKMKELWFYMGDAFSDGTKYVKKIRKAEKMGDYTAAVSRIFSECEISENPVFAGWR